jgi:hypothetical protein
MLDPLRSLAELVRTLTRPKTNSRSATGAATQRGTENSAAERGLAAASPDEILRERLRTQLRAVGGDSRRAREAFVSTVLASELGESISLDSGFAEIVSKVARQLGEDPDTSRNLAHLFDELTRDAR